MWKHGRMTDIDASILVAVLTAAACGVVFWLNKDPKRRRKMLDSDGVEILSDTIKDTYDAASGLDPGPSDSSGDFSGDGSGDGGGDGGGGGD